jgi:hypothetical protein
VVRRYKREKEALLKQILDPAYFPAEGIDGFALDKNGKIVRASGMTRG